MHGSGACVGCMVQEHVLGAWFRSMCWVHGSGACVGCMVQEHVLGAWFRSICWESRGL